MATLNKSRLLSVHKHGQSTSVPSNACSGVAGVVNFAERTFATRPSQSYKTLAHRTMVHKHSYQYHAEHKRIIILRVCLYAALVASC